MTAPVRLQLSRRKGFDLHALSQVTNGLPAVVVSRPGLWGNPFPVQKGTSTTMGQTSDIWTVGTFEGPAMWIKHSEIEARELAVATFRAWITTSAQASLRAEAQLALRGKNLACWCKPGLPCHADVLLELANRPTCDEVQP